MPTPDGKIVLCLLAIACLCVLLWIFRQARRNNGIAELPSFLMFGWGGAAWSPSVIVISSSAGNKPALIAHERCHQRQQLRDGWLRFYWRYLTNTQARLEYEVEAYKVWLAVSPQDRWRVIAMLINGYGFNLSRHDAEILLSR